MGEYFPYMPAPPKQGSVLSADVADPEAPVVAHAIPPPVTPTSASVASPTVIVLPLILIVPSSCRSSSLLSPPTVAEEHEATSSATVKLR
jgi:hypothetical protein